MTFALRPGSSLYFIGIGGIGMSALARIFYRQGYRVVGSDAAASTIVNELRKEGIDVFTGHHHKPTGVDVAVYSSAIGDGNDEYRWFVENKVPLVPRGMLLAFLMRQGLSVGVTGTHGKTTTSALIAYLAHEAGLQPTAVIGGYMKNVWSNIMYGNGTLYIAEVDESDKSHLLYSPAITVLTNLEEDHLDNYAGMDDIRTAFRSYLNGLAPDARIVYCSDDTELSALLADTKYAAISYGITSAARYQARNIEYQDTMTKFELWRDGRYVTDIAIRIPGTHNVLNALAAVAVLELMGRDACTLLPSFCSFMGVKRRLDVLYEDTSVRIVDDYAHHPTEIANVLQTVKRQGKRVVAVYQPHRYSRTKHLLNEYGDTFTAADKLIITDVYAAGEKPIDGITSHVLADSIRKTYTKSCTVVGKDVLLLHLNRVVQKGDTVIFLGAGDLTAVAQEYAKKQEAQQKSSHNAVNW